MTPDKLRDKVMADVAKKVRRFGRAVMSVFATDDSMDPTNDTFSYTIGNAPKAPELFVVGMNGEDAKWLLNTVSERLADGAPLGPLDLGGTFGVHVLLAGDAAKKQMGCANLWNGGSDYSVAQVVTPDKQGRFPWDVDCEPPYSRVRIFHKGH